MAEAEHPGVLCGRNVHTQQVSFIRYLIKSCIKDESFVVGVLPRGALILSMKAYVKTPLNNTKLKLGKEPKKQEYGEKDVKAAGVHDYAISADKQFCSDVEETVIYGTCDQKADNGHVVVLIEYVTDR